MPVACLATSLGGMDHCKWRQRPIELFTANLNDTHRWFSRADAGGVFGLRVLD